LVVDHVAHSKFNASSCPKEKIAHRHAGPENEGAKANHPVYSSVDVGQKIAPEDIE
jgi:hypothetical protein